MEQCFHDCMTAAEEMGRCFQAGIAPVAMCHQDGEWLGPDALGVLTRPVQKTAGVVARIISAQGLFGWVIPRLPTLPLGSAHSRHPYVHPAQPRERQDPLLREVLASVASRE
jgi:hypothetical protein